MDLSLLRTGGRLSALASLLLISSLASASPLPFEPVGASNAPEDTLLAQNVSIPLGRTGGALASGDAQLSSGKFYDSYNYTATAGEQLTISLTSPDFDTFLMVRGPGGISLDNDDRAPGDFNSQVVVTFPMAGTYQILASSYAAATLGAYELNLTSGATAPTAPVATGQANAGGGALTSGSTVTGVLAAGDSTLNSGEFIDTWIYTGQAGETLTIDLSSTEFDPYLMIRGPANFNHDNDDVVAGNFNSQLAVTLPTPGEYRVIATSYAPGETGAYTLSANASGGSTVQVPTQGATDIRGELATTDAMRAGRQYFDVHSFPGTASDRIAVSASASGFPVHLRLIEPSGEEHLAQATGAGEAAEINLVLPDTGDYTLHVSSTNPGSVGAYAVALTAAQTPTSTPTPGTGSSQLAFDVPLNGALAAGDAQLNTGEFHDQYQIEGVAGETVTIEMTSTAIDPYLFIRGPGEFALDNDDGPGMGLNSRLQVTFPTTGSYSLSATSYAPNEVGAYSLVMRAGSAVSNAGSGRLFAVLGGISEYTTASPLAGCAEDATALFQTLGDTGLLAPQSQVLTDRQLTRENLRRAFASVGSAMGPDDVFVFFFSGHGNQIAGSEFDGSDETLLLFDGEIRDDEVAELFSLIPGRIAMIALDSCFSGGFARDVIAAPGRMGVFSSEEDVTSNVAVRFSAGGYLSYFFRNGLNGGADIDPADSVITAGELAQYMRQQWAQHMLNERTETSDAESAWQNLVIDRGSVKVSDVILYRPR